MKTTHFCAICQKDSAHSLVIDPSGEVVVTCPGCQHFIKYPAVSPEALRCLMQEHKAQNLGARVAPPASRKPALDPAYAQALIDAGLADKD